MLATLGLVILLLLICIAAALLVGLVRGFLVAVALAWCSVVVPAIAFVPLFLVALGVLDDSTRALVVSATATIVIAVVSPVLHYWALRRWWCRSELLQSLCSEMGFMPFPAEGLTERQPKATPEWRAAVDRSIRNLRDRLLNGETQ